jgi:hypothetical protein
MAVGAFRHPDLGQAEFLGTAGQQDRLLQRTLIGQGKPNMHLRFVLSSGVSFSRLPQLMLTRDRGWGLLEPRQSPTSCIDW